MHYLWPNIIVDRVSCSLNDDGEQQMIIVVRALPPFTKQKVQEISHTNYVVDQQNNYHLHVISFTVHYKWFQHLIVLSYFRKLLKFQAHLHHWQTCFWNGSNANGTQPPKKFWYSLMFNSVNDSLLSVSSQIFTCSQAH